MKLKKKQQQFLIDAHKEVCQEWKTKLENNFPKLFQKVEFEVGKWYIKDVGITSLFVWSGNNNINYGFFGCEWGECWSMNFPKVWRPATDKEVEEALIKEAKRRGFVEGAKYIGFDEEGVEYFDGAVVCEQKYFYLIVTGKQTPSVWLP